MSRASDRDPSPSGDFSGTSDEVSRAGARLDKRNTWKRRDRVGHSVCNKCGVRRREEKCIATPAFLSSPDNCPFPTMSPHRIEVLPSLAALPQYDISKNGFLPAEPPLTRLPDDYYYSWECIIEELPTLIETQRIRQCVDALPILSTRNLISEAEWRRAHSMLAVIAQGYIWAGPEPSQVSAARTCDAVRMLANPLLSVFLQLSLFPSCKHRSIWRSIPSRPMRL